MGAALLELLRHELAIALRTRRVVAVLGISLLVALLGALLAQQAAAWMLEQIALQGDMGEDQAAMLLDAMTREHRGELVAGLVGLEHGQVLGVFADSIAASLLMRTMLFFLPGIALLVAFDRLATDVDSRALIFYGPRVPRPLVVVARALAATLVSTGIALACGLVSVPFLAHAFPDEGAGAALSALGVGALLLLPVAFAWCALVLLASSLVRRSFAALGVGLLFFVLWPLSGTLLGLTTDNPVALQLLAHLSPAASRPGLFSGLAHEQLSAVANWLVFGTSFLLLAMFRMHRRELVS